MKKTLLLVIAFSLLFNTFAFANVYINGRDVSDTVNFNNKTYVSVDSLTELLGGNILKNENNTYITYDTKEMLPQIIKEASEYVVGIIGKYSDGKNEGVSYGSGFVIKQDGVIFTNAHVVSGLKTILVVMNSGKTYEGKIQNIDTAADVALVKINASGLKTAKLADMSSVEVGQTVVAIGTPLSFSLRNSATMGIISGVNRNQSNDYRLLQSDAVLNHGNSGGPLINLKGEVVGMGTQGLIGVGVAGMYFSVTADTLSYALSHFEKYGRIRKPALGAVLAEDWMAEYDLPSDAGLEIKEIYENSAAQKANLLVGDRILGIKDIKFSNLTDYNEAMKKYLPGDTIPFKIIRGNSVFNVNILMN